MLTRERLKEVLHYTPETGVFVWRKRVGMRVFAGDVAGSINKKDGRRRIDVLGKKYLAHRLAWLYMVGEWPKLCIDHKDQDYTNNRWKNLREATKSQNGQNTSAFGVTTSRGKYQAQLQIAGRKKHLGYFVDVASARAAYLAAKRVHHPFAEVRA